MRILYSNDWHIRDDVPRNRVDNYIETQWDKLNQIKKIYDKEKPDIVLLGGDIFDKWNPPYHILNKLILYFEHYKGKVASIIGNHDILGYNLNTLENSAMGILYIGNYINILDGIFSDISVQCIDVRKENADSIKDYFKFETKPDIIISHDTIADDDLPFFHITCKQLDGCAKLVLCSHYHKPFLVKTENTTFLNAGSIMRMSIGDDWIPGVNIIDIEEDGIKEIRRINLNIVSYSEVFTNLTLKISSEIIVPEFNLENFGGQNLIDRVIEAGKNLKIKPKTLDDAVNRINIALEEMK